MTLLMLEPASVSVSEHTGVSTVSTIVWNRNPTLGTLASSFRSTNHHIHTTTIATTNMPYHVRPATIDDLDTLQAFVLAEAIEAEGATKMPSTVREGIRRGLTDPSLARYWVLEATNSASNDVTTGSTSVVGSISIIREWSDWHATFYWWIQSMFLAQQYRGKGLMKLLVNAVQDAARLENVMELRLYVHRDNQRALKAYRREGFQDSSYDIMQVKL